MHLKYIQINSSINTVLKILCDGTWGKRFESLWNEPFGEVLCIRWSKLKRREMLLNNNNNNNNGNNDDQDEYFVFICSYSCISSVMKIKLSLLFCN